MIYTPILYTATYVILGSAQAFRNNQAAIFACVCAYGIISALCIARSGQTPGLRYAGLVLVCQNGHKVGFLRACWRFLIWLVVASTLIGFFIPFFTQDKRFLHDVLCKTQLTSFS